MSRPSFETQTPPVTTSGKTPLTPLIAGGDRRSGKTAPSVREMHRSVAKEAAATSPEHDLCHHQSSQELGSRPGS